MNDINIWDIIIRDSRYNGFSKHKVERITKTMVILDDWTRLNSRLNVVWWDFWWWSPLYRKSTPELEEIYKIDKQARYINNAFHSIDLKKIDRQKLQALYDIFISLKK